MEGAQARLPGARAHPPEQLSPRRGRAAFETPRGPGEGERDRRPLRLRDREHVPHRRREPPSGPAVRRRSGTDRARHGGERGDPEGRDRRRRHALGRARDRAREEPLHVLGLRTRGPRGYAARARCLRPERHDESRQDLPGRRDLRRHPHRADQTWPRGGHVGVATHAAVAERAIDGVAPTRVERPRTTEELSALITAADRAREAVVLWGGGTRIGVGDAPDRYDAALELTGLAGIVEHSPADLVCTVRAGTTLAELARALGPRGRRWPGEAPGPDRATVGGPHGS